MLYGVQGLRGVLSGGAPAAGKLAPNGSAGSFLRAMAGAWTTGLFESSAGNTLQSPAAETVSGAARAMDTVSAWGHTNEIAGTTLEEMLRNVHPQLSYHVMDCSSSNWLRNDFPHYKLFQQNVNKYEIEHWQPSGDEPTQANSPATHRLCNMAPGSVAIVIHPAVQEKMEQDPTYAREIFERIEAWFAFDDARDIALRAARGESGLGIEQRAVAIGEDGLITNALAASSGRLTFSSSGSSGRHELSGWEKRMLRHDQYMRERVERQIESKYLASQQLNAMSIAASARQKVVAMMQDPALRAALGERVGRVPLDTMFSISMDHINAAAGL